MYRTHTLKLATVAPQVLPASSQICTTGAWVPSKVPGADGLSHAEVNGTGWRLLTITDRSR